MSSTQQDQSRRRQHLVLLIAMAIACGTPSFGAAPMTVPPDPRSPLATDGTNVYAVGKDGQSILISRGGKGNWNQLAVLPGADIRGLAWGGRLFVSNAADASIHSISTTAGNSAPVLLHRGAPLKRPTELAFSMNLFIVDPGAGTLFRLPTGGRGSLGPASPVPIRSEYRLGERTFITGWGPGEVLISDAASGLLAQVIGASTDDVRFRAMQEKKGDSESVQQWNQAPGKAETIRRQGYPGVQSPAAIAFYNGIVYVVDDRSGDLFVAGAHDARAVRVPTPEPGVPVTRLVANSVELTALDAKGHLHSWPRLVPAELTLLPGARPQSLFPVLEYLHRRKLLLTRRVTVATSIGETLSATRMQWPILGEPKQPETPEGNFASFCMLNEQLCANRLPKPSIPPGTPILMADIYAERFTTAGRVTLDGSKTLAEVADAAITSEQFASLTSESALRRLNGIPDENRDSIRDVRTGTFRISREQVRYVIPIEASELRQGNGDFQRLQMQVRDTLRIAPLERVTTTAAASKERMATLLTPTNQHDPAHPHDPACEAARKAMAQLLKTINYSSIAPQKNIFVGVAEDDFDPDHPDFTDATTPNGILYLVTDANELQLAPINPPGTPPAGGEPVTWRGFESSDHGTAVAALIAGRRRPYQDGPGLSRALIGMFTRTSNATALADDIDRAVNQSNMTVVNLSLRNVGRVDSEKLRILMELKQDLVLFVISAPNSPSRTPLCTEDQVFFPACHGDKFENVVVVGGTTLLGDSVHAKSPIGNSVHLFAPETGYFSAGRQNSYVPVEGTSFATALVSATAAMLSSAGINSPALIKQRLIATANVIPSAERPQWARLLDVKRALSHLSRAVLVDANTGAETPIDLQNKNDFLQFKTAQGNRTISVRVADIRRLRRVPNNPRLFDLAFVAVKPGGPPNLRNETLHLQAVSPGQTPWNVCYFHDTTGQRTCVDLAEVQDYVGPIQ